MKSGRSTAALQDRSDEVALANGGHVLECGNVLPLYEIYREVDF
jgi:hypothetical protein